MTKERLEWWYDEESSIQVSEWVEITGIEEVGLNKRAKEGSDESKFLWSGENR